MSIEALFSLESAQDLRESLDHFVAHALFDAGVWPSPRASDGVMSWRVAERTPARLRVCGRLWQIDQTLHSFWLDVERAHALPEHITWTLYFDIDVTSLSDRRARNVVDSIEEPTDVTWVVTLNGRE